jgi:outer membrane protein OmpA-like peptidoglycan-associated protein
VELDGYAFLNETVKLPGAGAESRTINRTVALRKLAVGVSGVLRNIYFDFDKWSFKNESYNELNKLERMMHQNPNIQVEISGHTDNIGTRAYNMFLSRKRAEAVKDFLTGKGIDARRVKAAGYGESRPLASNDDEREGRELNLRVEFLVIGE